MRYGGHQTACSAPADASGAASGRRRRASLLVGAGSARPHRLPPKSRTGCPSSRFSFGGRVRRKLRAHALPDDELLAGPVPLDPSASDSTLAVHADGVVALSVEHHLDGCGAAVDRTRALLVPVRQSTVTDVPTGVVTVQSTLHRATIVALS